MSNIYMDLVKEAYDKDELELLLRADDKYVYDNNHKYKYATSPEHINMDIDEIDPISYSNLVDGIKLFDLSLQNERGLKVAFEKKVVESIKNMAGADNIVYVYFAARITYILYSQKLRDTLPKYYVLNYILDNIIDVVKDSLISRASDLKTTHLYGGKNRECGLWEYIKDTMDNYIVSINGQSLLK